MSKKFLTPLTASFLAGAAMMGAASAQSQTCTKAGDTRTLEVLTPGVVGKACDLRYTYNNGATVKTPYHANNSAGFCAQKAQTLLAELANDGFSCEVSNVSTVSVESVAPAVEEVASVEEPVAEAAASLPEAPVIEDVAEVVAEDVEVAAPDPAPEPLPAVAQNSEATVETVVPELNVEAADAAPEPAPVAQQGPVTLTTASAVTTTARAPRQSAVGRLMGAEPEEPAIVEPEPVHVAEVVATSTPSAPEERLAPAMRDAAEKVAPTTQATKKVQKLRPAPDIIRGVLAAQAAAWNEGDLEAFMGGYWKSPDLRFVSGTEVTGGWSQTLKRYKNRYGDGGDLGELSFKKLDVEMITDDVAVVVGRFNLEKDTAADTGVFTLVMKRFNGRWRIVHDHTVGEQTASTE